MEVFYHKAKSMVQLYTNLEKRKRKHGIAHVFQRTFFTGLIKTFEFLNTYWPNVTSFINFIRLKFKFYPVHQLCQKQALPNDL